MNILEKDIEDLLFEALEERPELLREIGFNCSLSQKYYRQPDLGSYGRPDIIGCTISRKYSGLRYINFSVFELKKDEINIQTLIQAGRYATGLRQFVKKSPLTNVHVEIQIYLVGRTIEDTTDFVFLLDQMDNVDAYTFKLNLGTGLTFQEQSGYYKKNHGFKSFNLSYPALRVMAKDNVYFLDFKSEENIEEPI